MRRWIYFTTQILAGGIFKSLNMISRCVFGLLLFRLEIEGIENIKGLKGPIIITPNHKSYCDHFFFITAIIGNNSGILPARVMVADWILRIPFVGWALKNIFGAYPVRKVRGLDVSLRNPLRALAQNYMVAIYPEGGIHYGSGVNQAKKGAAYLAKKSAVPILPAAIQGAEGLSLKAFLFGRKRIRVLFGKPFYVGIDENVSIASEEIRRRIVELYDKTENICQLPT